MTILQMLYQFFIGPLTLAFQFVYSLSYELVYDAGLAVIPLSLVLNLFLLPLYNRAEALQAEERAMGAQLARGVAHIKKTFTGDMRFMMLQTYYRQNNYRPWYALRSALPLLLQIPFFMAAYQFLSHLSLLQGASFGPITNLAAPDGLLQVGGVSLNVLPVLMTLINVLSTEVYAKGLPLGERLKLHGMAVIFLVLLYPAPAGLSFYWTLNNLFSLAKNVVKRSPNPKRAACVAFAAGAALLFYV